MILLENMIFEPDNLLSADLDSQTFGINLACSWPLPSPLAEVYQDFSAKVKALDPALYVYPYPETHITIMTLVDFKDTIGISPEQGSQLEKLAGEISSCLENFFAEDHDLAKGPISLRFDRAVLTPKAAYLAFDDPADRIGSLRKSVASMLPEKFPQLSLHYPGIVHSTFLRFLDTPADPRVLSEKFGYLALELRPVTIQVPELLLTIETSPYMRSGKILNKFPLS